MTIAGAEYPTQVGDLLETVLNLRKGRVQFGADVLDCGEDHNGNASGDKGIFDSGGAGLIPKEVVCFGHDMLR